MCRVTSASPPPSFTTKRSSLSTSSSTSSIRSTDSNGFPKRVSFSDRVEVYKLEPLGTDEANQVFYCSHDYRRFRSDQCLELLDQQLEARAAALKNKDGPVRAAFHVFLAKLVSPMAKQKRQLLKQTKAQHEAVVDQLPWMTAYHPQEEPVQEQSQAPQVQVQPAVEEAEAEQAYEGNRAAKTMSSREQLLIQELAFFWDPIFFWILVPSSFGVLMSLRPIFWF